MSLNLGLIKKTFFFNFKQKLLVTLPQIISIFKSCHICHKNSLNIDVLKTLYYKFGRISNLSFFLDPETKSLLHIRSKVSIAPFHVRSKVCIAPFHVRSKVYKFGPHMYVSNADLASHMEGSHADFARHMERRHSCRDQK